MVVSCDRVVAEAKGILNICYETQRNMDYNEREEVFKLLVLIDTKKPRYTAADYFTLNKSTIFALLSTVTTYFIVLV